MGSARGAFTIMELLTVIVILGILSLMVMSTVGSIQGKAARGKCVSNLKTLYAAGVAYLQDHGSWPQIPVNDLEDPSFAKAWISAFRPYKLSEVNWTCSTVQLALENPPPDPDAPRIDYIPTSFDARPSSPWLYPTHPWFVERADVHGDGNLLIFTNGQVHSLKELSKAVSSRTQN
jgi:prepilin-type N-terminal cleavage/methylation domain-containing protein